GVRDIEDGKLIITVIVEQDKINHAAHSNAIHQVPADAGRQQRQRPEQQSVRRAGFEYVINNDRYRNHRYGHQEPFYMSIINYPKSNSLVLGIAEFKESVDDIDLISVA